MDNPQSSASTNFDPYAVAPAFARPSYADPPPPPQQQVQPSASSSSTCTTSNPSQKHQQILSALTDPSLMGELPTTDPLSILLQKHLPPHIRPPRDLSGTWHTFGASAPSNEIPDPFSADTAPLSTEMIDVESVRKAAASNSWRKIASLARIKVEQYSSPQLIDAGDPLGEVLQWWSIRLYALTRLKLYSLLRTELGSICQVLEAEEVDVDIPFTLQVLKATEPKFRGDLTSTLEQYTSLIRLCKRRMREIADERQRWRGRAERVGFMLAFALAEAKDYAGAIELVAPLVEGCLAAQGERLEDRVHLIIVASRLWIQAGDLSTAASLLDRASTLVPPDSPLRIEITHTHSLINTISSNPTTSTTDTRTSHLNAAIAAFYSAHLDSAIHQLESVMKAEPHMVAGTDAVVFNLVTLYELGKGGERQVVESKRDVLAKVARWAGEPGVGASSFKL